MTPIRILIADDHPVVRAGIVGMFSGHSEFQVVGEAANGGEVIRLAEQLHPDVILMDLRMPTLNGVEAMQRILRTQPNVHILVLTTYDTDQDIYTALSAGAAGYLLKDAPREELYQAVHLAVQGKTAFGMSISTRLIEQQRLPGETLSEREITVLALVAQGDTSKMIGKKLHISEATVKTHLKHIYTKLGVTDRAAAVALALERNIIRLTNQ
jgi:DNA-binding NarL/FixJ family response regulator